MAEQDINVNKKQTGNIQKQVQANLRKIISSSDKLNKQICRTLTNNIKQWGTQNTEKNKQDRMFLNSIESSISKIENLEHITQSLMTGLRDHIWTIISLMEEIKPTGKNSDHKWIQLINRCQLNNEENQLDNSKCEFIQCRLHKPKAKHETEITKIKESSQPIINNIEFYLINDGMTKAEHEKWMNESQIKSEIEM